MKFATLVIAAARKVISTFTAVRSVLAEVISTSAEMIVVPPIVARHDRYRSTHVRTPHRSLRAAIGGTAKALFGATLPIFSLVGVAGAEPIRVASLGDSRVACGYAFFNGPVHSSIRGEVLNPSNFGANGIVPREVVLLPPLAAFTASGLAGADVVFATEGYMPSASELAVLGEFVRRGGGLFVFSNTAAAWYGPIFGGTGGDTGSGCARVTATNTPVTNGPFGVVPVSECISPTTHGSFVNHGCGATVFMASQRPVGIFYERGLGRAVLICDEEWIMNARVCPALTTFGPRKVRLFLNALAFVAPPVTEIAGPRVVCSGERVTLSLNHAPSGSTFQWRRNGTPIDVSVNPSAGTTALTISNALAEDAGVYDVVIANACASVTSDPATLTIQSGAWVQLPVTGPSPRIQPSLAYDSVRQRAVLFGGSPDVPNNIHSNETWEWDGAGWTQVALTGTRPRARRAAAMAYDSIRQRVVLYGGFPGTGQPSLVGDTWEWDGAQWHQVITLNRPNAGTSLHCMAFDANRGVCVLVGGTSGGGIANLPEVWEYNGIDWSQRPGGGSIGPRHGHATVYDSISRRIVIAAGYGGGGLDDLGSTHAWNGTTWTTLASSGLTPRHGHDMAFDPVHNRIVLFGGELFNPIRLHGDTLEWNGSSWTNLSTPGPTPRTEHSIVYDEARGQFVMFGGQSANPFTRGETWVFSVAPVITQHPSAAATCASGSAMFVVAAGGIGPFTYQWQWEEDGAPGVWTNLAEGPNTDSGGIVRFTATGALSPSVVVARDNHLRGAVNVIQSLRCIVTNSCGSLTSNAASLTVCVADTDDGSGTGTCDGGVTIDDFLYYLSIFEQGLLAADLDNGTGTGMPDGGVTIDDLLYFLARYEAGC